MFVFHGLPRTPTDHVRVIGKAVIHPTPWHLAGDYMAGKERQARGDDYTSTIRFL